MDAVSNLEDLDNLVVAEDLIILALRDSWQAPKTGRLPVGFHLDSARRVLTTDEKTLTAHRTLLGRKNVATAVFAGCSGFELAKSFRMAAKQVLDGTGTLAIVHNQDMIWDLVDWFPTVKTLVLPHNVRLQFDEIVRSQPAARHSDLEELLGNVPAMGCTDLYINRNAIIALLAKCPKLRRLQASLHGDLMSGREHSAYDAILSHEALRSCREVRLGSYLERVDNTAFVMEGVSAKGLTCAHKVFPEVTYLELVLKSPDVVPTIAKFTRLTALIVAFSFELSLLDFTPNMSSVLDKLPLLEELSLNYFRVVSVGDIARKCPRLQKLSLMHCVLVVESAEAVRSRKHPFPPKALEFLKIHVMCSDKDYLIALLTSCSGQVSHCTFRDSDDISDTQQDTESEESDDLPARLARIDSVCEKYADLLWTDPTDDRASWDRKYCGRDVCSFYLVERRRFGFCPIPKAATSSLKTLILEAERLKDPGDNADEIFFEFKKRFPSVLPCPHWDNKLGSEYSKLIIVRHPFERLVSAYVDKIRTTDPFIPGAKAMYKHGFVGKGPNGTFTFSEFVSNILKEPVEKWDEHWAPFTTRCRPCSMRYDVIAKVETLDQDLKTLLPRIGLQGQTFPARNVKTRSNESSRKEFSHYISELPRQQLLHLHAIYMYDFELFGYKLAGYTDPVL